MKVHLRFDIISLPMTSMCANYPLETITSTFATGGWLRKKMDRSIDKPGTSGTGASTQQGSEKFLGKGKEQDGGEREEIVKLWRQMDEKLEHKAKSHNLSVVNVKTILHVSKHMNLVSRDR